MSLVVTNSTTLANIAATPPVRNDVRHSAGRNRFKTESVVIPAAFAALDQVRFFRIKAHDSIKSIRLWSDDIATTSCTVDVGVYAINGGAVVDVDAYATDIDMASAIADQEIRFEILDHNTINQAVWEDAGVADEPTAGTEYDLVATVAAVTDPLTGDITLLVTYAAGD